jgi:hypothetical protein
MNSAPRKRKPAAIIMMKAGSRSQSTALATASVQPLASRDDFQGYRQQQ